MTRIPPAVTIAGTIFMTLGFFAGLHYAGMTAEPYRALAAALRSG